MPKRSPGSHTPDDINKRFGDRLRLARQDAGRSQSDVGDALGVSFQQIQKYENGTTSISLNRLETIARFLGVQLVSLLDGLDPSRTGGSRLGFAEEGQAAFDSGAEAPARSVFLSRDKTVLLEAFGRIGDRKLRKSVLSIVEAMSLRDAEHAGDSGAADDDEGSA